MSDSNVVLRVDPRFAGGQRKREIPRIAGAVLAGLVLGWLGADDASAPEKAGLMIVLGAFFGLVIACSYRQGERVFAASRIHFMPTELTIQLGRAIHRIQRETLQDFEFVDEHKSIHWLLKPKDSSLPAIEIRKRAFPSFKEAFRIYSESEPAVAPDP